MNLNGAVDEIALPVHGDEIYIHNTWTDSIPTVIHGNGPSKVKDNIQYFLLINHLLHLQKTLNYLGNYIARARSSTEGCLQCKENLLDLTKIEDVRTYSSFFC